MKPRAGGALAVAGGLVGLYIVAAFVLPGDLNVAKTYDELFDLDVARVVREWTRGGAAGRAQLHPLQQLALAPIGTTLRGLGLAPLDAVRWIAIAAMTLNALLVGRLASQLAGGSTLPGVVAAVLCGVSFSSVLLVGVPDSASVSGLGTVVPLLYLNRRVGRTLTSREALTWGLVGVFCIAFTISQVANWAIALAVRVAARRNVRADLARVLAAVAIFACVTGGLTKAQSVLHPGTRTFLDGLWVESELSLYGQRERLREHPVEHVARLAWQFAGVNFVAPMPGYARWGRTHWSLSVEGRGDWHPAQRVLLGAWLLLLTAALVFGRPRASFLAPALCVAAQFVLHLFYGREYVMYSPNWHGVVTAMLVASAWNGRFGRKPWLLAGVALFSLATAANSLAVMDRVYEEKRTGLTHWQRDAEGHLRPDR